MGTSLLQLITKMMTTPIKLTQKSREKKQTKSIRKVQHIMVLKLQKE